MPALESRRVRTQPFTVTGASFGARPARMSRTLSQFSAMPNLKSGTAGESPRRAVLDELDLVVHVRRGIKGPHDVLELHHAPHVRRVPDVHLELGELLRARARHWHR